MGVYFNVGAMFIVLREVLEMGLVIGILYGYCKKSGYDHKLKYIWAGAGTAISIATILGAAFGAVYHNSGEALFTFPKINIFEGALVLTAAALLTWMIIWAKVTGSQLQKEMEGKMRTALDSDSNLRIFLLPFVQVLREGVEIVIFMAGMDTGGLPWQAIPISAIVGALIAIVIVTLLFKGVVRLNISAFFDVTGYILMFFAAAMVAYGTHEWQEVGWFGPWTADMTERSWVNQIFWSTDSIGDQKENQFFAIFRALFGYSSGPNFMTLFPYCFYWVSVLSLVSIVTYRNGMITQKRIDQYLFIMKIEVFLTLFWYLLMFVWACSVSQHPFQAFVMSIFGSSLMFACLLASASTEKIRSSTKRRLALYNLVGWAVLTIFIIIVILVQLDCAGKGKCGAFATNFFYDLFVLNRAYNIGGRGQESWHSGAVLTIALVMHMFHGYLHGLFSFYLYKKTASTTSVLPLTSGGQGQGAVPILEVKVMDMGKGKGQGRGGPQSVNGGREEQLHSGSSDDSAFRN